VRDAVLGAKILSGTGEVLSFGGEVMKNVAGYDVSRVMTGSLGTLGILLEVSLKVMPCPAAEATRTFAMDEAAALRALAEWGRRPLPFAGTCHHEGRLHLRLAGNAGAVAEAAERLGGEEGREGDGFWADLREQRLPFFRGEGSVWRLSVPPAAPPLGLPGETLTEWGGALRWLRSEAPATEVRGAAAAAGGHAVLFRGGDSGEPAFPPLPRPLMTLHRNLKRAMDPHGLFNPGRMYEGV
jgi:glycolate oxidase FAD binding subunit